MSDFSAPPSQEGEGSSSDAEIDSDLMLEGFDPSDRWAEYSQESLRTAWRAGHAVAAGQLPGAVAAAVAAVRADRDLLAGQVAAIRALHREVKNPYQERTGMQGACGECSSQAYFTDGMGSVTWWPCPTIAALVASSPTTPAAKK